VTVEAARESVQKLVADRLVLGFEIHERNLWWHRALRVHEIRLKHAGESHNISGAYTEPQVPLHANDHNDARL